MNGIGLKAENDIFHYSNCTVILSYSIFVIINLA